MENWVVGLILGLAFVVFLIGLILVAVSRIHAVGKSVLGTVLGVLLGATIVGLVIFIASLINNVAFYEQGRLWFGYGSAIANYFDDASHHLLIGVVLGVGVVLFGSLYLSLLFVDFTDVLKTFLTAIFGFIFDVLLSALVFLLIAVFKNVSVYSVFNEMFNSVSSFGKVFVK